LIQPKKRDKLFQYDFLRNWINS